ncbi:MAG: hypothetical protein E6Q85_07990 [Thiothrix sp.]|nr:MAG: hypothetical protein E6Q85_07990 [Thiothrix sp.]
MLPKTMQELDAIRDECYSMVTNRSTASAAAAIVPVPGVDIAADVALLLDTIPSINNRFGLSQEQINKLDPQTKKLILVAIKGIGSNLIAKTITKEMIVQVLKTVGVRLATKQVAKYIPFIGSAVAATLSFTAMKYVGNSHVDDCYNVAKRIISK